MQTKVHNLPGLGTIQDKLLYPCAKSAKSLSIFCLYFILYLMLLSYMTFNIQLKDLQLENYQNSFVFLHIIGCNSCSQWQCGLRCGSGGHSPAGGMDVCRECCVLSGRCFCVRLITHPLASNKCSKCNYILHTSKCFIYGPLHNACRNLFVLVFYLMALSATYTVQGPMFGRL